MASKRAAESGIELKPPKSKRPKTSSNRTDPSATQRGAFGDLENGTTAPTGDSDLDCEDDSEALAYLKSVRSQASTIPHVLVAQKAGPPPPPPPPPPPKEEGLEEEEEEEQTVDRTIYETGIGDSRGYYEDGAYISYPDRQGQQEDSEQGSKTSEPPRKNSNSTADEIRDAYFASLANRYAALREILHSEPPTLPPHPTVDEWKRGAGMFRVWETRLRAADPTPVQIASMSKDTVFRLLHILLTGKFLRKRQELRVRTSRWIWALLARLPDKGELDYMEVGWIRELGKRAVLMMVSLAELEVLREHCGVAGEDEDEDEYVEDAEEKEEEEEDAPLDADGPLTPVEQDGVDIQETKNATSLTAAAPPRRNSIENASDVEMQLDSDLEDGEIEDAASSPPPGPDSVSDVEAAKARLLAQLKDDVGNTTDGPVEEKTSQLSPGLRSSEAGEQTLSKPVEEDVGDEALERDDEEEGVDYESYEEPDRGKVNERVTLNMILTVAGEFYGQRDLLEFRDPFGGLQFG